MAITKAIRIGTYRSSSVRPPRDALGRVKEGMLPKMISRTSGKPTPQIGPIRSRRNSRNSVRVSRRSAVTPDGGARRRRGGPGGGHGD